MTDIAIRCDGLGKQYRIGQREGFKTLRDTIADALSSPFGRLRSAFNRASVQGGNGRDDSFWALRDVSFEIKRGEVVGIIGRNGAGKSTLLKILSRITQPTEGEVVMSGRVASLLEVGTGFHPELTGRENIFLNGAILGMKRAEITRKFDEIVAFAEIEKFIDTPVKRYSSGMYVRLAFAVAAHLEPEILVVDEVLAVGDAAFQKKCLGKLDEVAHKGGRTVLFVSHNMAAVRQICGTGILLNAGKIQYIGSAAECVGRYVNGSAGDSNDILSHISHNNPNVEITSITVNDSPDDQLQLQLNPLLGVIKITVRGRLTCPLRLEIELTLLDPYGAPLAFFSPGHERGYADTYPAGDFCITRFMKLPNRMNRGEYYLDIALTEPDVNCWLDVQRAVRISFEGSPTQTGRVMDYTAGKGWLFLSEPQT